MKESDFESKATDQIEVPHTSATETSAKTTDSQDYSENSDLAGNNAPPFGGYAVPISTSLDDLEVPSKKVSLHLTGEQYLKYKNMMDTLLFPKKTGANAKDEILLGAAVDYLIQIAHRESQKSMDTKGTPFISAGALLANLI